MSDLRVSPWKRYGHDRLYVSTSEGANVAWLDRVSGRLTVLDESHRADVLTVLAPHLPSDVPAPAEREPVIEAPAVPPPVASAGDLAGNRPGEALRGKVAELEPHRWRSLGARLLGRPSEADSWRAGLRGEQSVGKELQRLTAHGWCVLHSLPLPRDVDIDHLLIGPGGVFCLNAKHHPKAEVWVGDHAVKIGGRSYPYVRKSRSEARRAERALTGACGFPVEVRPVLVFVGAARLTVVPSLLDVRVVQARELAALGPANGVLAGREIEAVYEVARRPQTWESA